MRKVAYLSEEVSIKERREDPPFCFVVPFELFGHWNYRHTDVRSIEITNELRKINRFVKSNVTQRGLIHLSNKEESEGDNSSWKIPIQ